MDNKANDFEHGETIGTLFGKPIVVNADLDKDADDEATKGFERILKNKYPWIYRGENINESKDGNNGRQSQSRRS